MQRKPQTPERGGCSDARPAVSVLGKQTLSCPLSRFPEERCRLVVPQGQASPRSVVVVQSSSASTAFAGCLRLFLVGSYSDKDYLCCSMYRARAVPHHRQSVCQHSHSPAAALAPEKLPPFLCWKRPRALQTRQFPALMITHQCFCCLHGTGTISASLSESAGGWARGRERASSCGGLSCPLALTHNKH